MREIGRRMAVVCVLCVMGLGGSAGQGEGAKGSGVRGPLIVNEICPGASHAASPWIELVNSSNGALSLAGTVLESAPKVAWELPSGLPPVPKGAFVLVLVDADGTAPGVQKRGPDLIVLHAPAALAKPWAAVRGELAIYRLGPSNAGGLQLVDFVAWGAPSPVKGQKKRGTGHWPASWFVPLAEGFGVYDPTTRLAPGASIGLYPGNAGGLPDDWAIYDMDEATPGEPNGVPRPKAFTPGDGAVVGSNSLAVGWARRKGDERYRFQLAADKGFGKILLDTALSGGALRIDKALPDGTYFYRVGALSQGHQSPWGATRVITTITTTCDGPLRWPPRDLAPAASPPPVSATFEEVLLRLWCGSSPDCRMIPTLQFKFQRKDTPLVCLQCCQQTSNSCNDCGGNHPHPYCVTCDLGLGAGFHLTLCAGDMLSAQCEGAECRDPRTVSECEHGRNYCVMASISMIASAYGACLSQDRIAYKICGGANCSGGDLSHGQPVSYRASDGGTCSNVLDWALDGMRATYYPGSIGDFWLVRDWIDQRRPIMTKAANHMRVLSGYCIDHDDRPWVFIYDPRTGPRAEPFSSWRCDSDATWVAPPASSARAHPVKADEPSIWLDSDSDCLTDFDETQRFGTDPATPTSPAQFGCPPSGCPTPTPTPRP
jgi:hypothetical protein